MTDFLNRLWLLTPEQVGRLVGGWQNAPRDELRRAHESLQALVDEDPEWREQVRHAQEKLTAWLNAGRIQETAGFLGQAGQGESRKMAGPALADAVAALVLGDLLDAGGRGGPLRAVVQSDRRAAAPRARGGRGPQDPSQGPGQGRRGQGPGSVEEPGQGPGPGQAGPRPSPASGHSQGCSQEG